MNETPILSLKALSVLLCYPTVEMIEALPEIEAALNNEGFLAKSQRKAVRQFIETQCFSSLLELQENYVSLFDRGRALSLHIFEHIHGESRERGQAMVDLMGMYQSHGFEINAHELPDYIPLFLEYLSQRPVVEACESLGDVAHIFHVLAQRLEAKQSPYFLIFDALSALAGKERTDIRQVPKADAETDETILKMDEIWEEETVSFMANPNSCGSGGQTPAEQPLVFRSPKSVKVH